MATFEQQLKQRLANASKPAPATDGDWERLQAALAANAPKKKRAAWWLWGTAAVGVFSLGFLVFSLEMGDGLFDYAQSDREGSLPTGQVGGKMNVGAGFIPAQEKEKREAVNQLPNVGAGFTPAQNNVGAGFTPAQNNVGAGFIPAQENVGAGFTPAQENVGAGFTPAQEKERIEDGSQLPPTLNEIGTDGNKSEAEIPKPETPTKTNTPPTPPKIQLPKKASLPIRAGIETTVLGSKQNAKGGNAAFAQIRKDGDKRAIGYSSQLTLELKTKNYELATGLGFQQQNFGGNYIYPYKWVDSFPVYVGGVIVGWGKNPPRDTTLNYSLNSSVKTVFIPVKIRFTQKLGSKWGAIVETGMQYGFVVGADGQFISPDKNLPNILDLQTLRKHTFTLLLGLGSYYDANRWLRLYLQTGYGRQLTSIFKQYNTTSNSLSLTFGCQFKL